MTIRIIIPWSMSQGMIRRLLAVIGVFAPNATVQVGSHQEQTLPSQIAPVPGLSKARLRPVEVEEVGA